MKIYITLSTNLHVKYAVQCLDRCQPHKHLLALTPKGAGWLGIACFSHERRQPVGTRVPPLSSGWALPLVPVNKALTPTRACNIGPHLASAVALQMCAKLVWWVLVGNGSSNVHEVEQVLLRKAAVVITVAICRNDVDAFTQKATNLSSTNSTPKWDRSTEKDVLGRGKLISFSRPMVCLLLESEAAASNAALMVSRRLDVWLPIVQCTKRRRRGWQPVRWVLDEIKL